jgi:tetratricopeptide (TPR) repeat protein
MKKTIISPDRCGGKSALANKRTEEVCQEFLMPMTKELKLSYCDLLKLEPNQKKIGIASVFISHAWKFLFLDVVQAIERHFQKEITGPDSENFYIWFDLFSNNQHIAGELDFQWWTQTFRSAIEQFNHTVIILAPWNNPIPFKRAWCLWEIYCSIITESKFEVALSDTEHFSLIDTMIYNFDAIEQMISNINCEQSECWKPEDRLNIFNAVRLTEGFDHINSIIMKKMQSWLLSSVCAEVESNARIIKDSLQYFQLQVVIGKIQLLQGNHREAKETFLKSFDFYHQRTDLLDGVEGMKNRKCYLEACLHLAEISLVAQGYDEVNQFFDIHLLYLPNEKSLEENEMIKLKISFMMIKFKLLIECDAFRDSYEAILKYYKLSIERLTKTSNLTITFMGQIGYLYYRLDEYEKSSRYFIEALNVIKTKNLSNYLFAIEIKYYYCLLLIKQSNFELCKQIMEQCYRFCDVSLGDMHPKTLLYYFLFQKANYLLQQGRDYGFMDYSAEIDCYRNLTKKLPMFLSVFSENSSELLEILRLFNSFEYHRYNNDILVHYMKSIKFHYARNPEKYRDEYYHVLLDLARSQSGNRSMLQVIDLENAESFENYNEAIQLMKPQLPLYRKELIDAYHTFGFLQSNLIEREKIFEESLLLEKEQSKVTSNPQYFRKSDTKFFLADTYYRQGKYSKWWKYHWEHCIDSGTCGGYYDLNYNYALPFANCLRFCYYCGNFPCHYCWSCGGVTAKETNEPTFPCDGLCGFCCYFNFWFGIYCSWPCQFICLLPWDSF